MKYLLMMHTPGQGPYPPMVTWAKKDMDAHLEFLRQFDRAQAAARDGGERDGGHGVGHR